MKYLKYTWLVCLMIDLIIQGPVMADTSLVRTPIKAQETVDRVHAMLLGFQKTPDHLMRKDAHKQGTEFQTSRFFHHLPHLSMAEGYVLDYVYAYGGLGGEPILYARKINDPPLKTLGAYAEHFQLQVRWPHKDLSYLEKIVVKDSQEGFFQLVVLQVMGNQFYQFWHCKYNDDVIVCEAEVFKSLWRRLEAPGIEMVDIPDDVKREAAAVDCTPQVVSFRDRVVVEVVIFSKWKGVVRRAHTIARRYPHRILAEKEDVLVPYNWGVNY